MFHHMSKKFRKMKFEIRYYKELDSTNASLTHLLNQNDVSEGTVIQTGYQTEGKGHGGNTWMSEKDKSLLFSILLKPINLAADRQFDLSRIVCLALYDLIKPSCGDVSIKWPNDLYIGNRKIAGILIENTIQQDMILHSVVGVGLNVNQAEFDPAIPSPTSMYIEKECHFDIKALLDSFLQLLNKWYLFLNQGDKQAIYDSYLSRLYRFGIWSDFKSGDEELNAKITGVMPGGEINLETHTGESLNFGFKDIEFLP